MSTCWKYTFSPECDLWSSVYLLHRWKLTLISNYCASVGLWFSLPESVATQNVSKIVCSFIGEKIQITTIPEPSGKVEAWKFRAYNVVFRFYFKYGIYHTIFHLNNGKFNYDLDKLRNYNSKVEDNCNHYELKFKIYLNVSQDNTSGIKIKKITKNVRDWLQLMSAAVGGYDTSFFAHNYVTQAKLCNLVQDDSPIGCRMCFIYGQNNILIGLNPFMEYYEQTRIMIEEIQYIVIGNGYCATDTSWIDILFEYITFMDFESNCGILNDRYDDITCTNTYRDTDNCNDIINDIDTDIDIDDNTNVEDWNFDDEKDDCIVNTRSTTDDEISCMNDYHRKTLDSITDSNNVYDVIGFKRPKGIKYRYDVSRDYYENRGAYCRACIVYQHKPNVISSCLVAISGLCWCRCHPEIYITNYELETCRLSTMQLQFRKVYPKINSKHNKRFRIWLTNRSIIPFVKNVQENFEKHEAVTNNFDFDAKYNYEDDSDMIKSSYVGPRDKLYKDRYTTAMINEKYKNKKRKKKWTRTGYFDKKSNVKTKHLRKQKYQNNFNHELYDYQCNK